MTDQPRDLLGGLNEAQRAAVTHEGVPLAVLAGPGTGKTRVITHRVAHMISQRGISPENIVALTFTNKAAEELRTRLGELLDASVAERITASTFHAFGRSLLRRFADIAGLPLDPHLIDSAERRRALREVIAEQGLYADAAGEGVDSAVAHAADVIDSLSKRAISPGEAIARAEAIIGGLGTSEDDAGARARLNRFLDAARAASGFGRVCAQRGWVTFADMVARPAALIRENDTVRDISRADYTHFVVDEFQDVNRAQIELLAALAPPGGRADLCVVGDDDQSIYAFRGADELAFERFANRWPQSERIALRENYRSARPVLDAAQAIIERAESRFDPDKVVERADALSDEPDPLGAGVEVVRLDEWRDDGDVIAAMVRTSVESDTERSYADFAVIARTNGDLERIAHALELEGVPARVSRAPSPFDDAGVQDVMAWVDLVLDPRATWAAGRLLRRPPLGVDVTRFADLERAYRAQRSRANAAQEGVEDPGAFPAWLEQACGADSAESPVLARFAALHQRFVDLATRLHADEAITEIIREAGVAHAELLESRERSRRVAALVALIRFARQRRDRMEPPGDLRAFRRYLDELDEKERKRAAADPNEAMEAGEDGPATDAVTLITAHASKGLEFDTVLLPRVAPADGYPKKRSDDEDPVPHEITGETREQGCLDEERRVFYVACTRARRRLVLLAKLPKGKSKSTHYTLELLAEQRATDRCAADVWREAEEAGVASGEPDELRREAARYASARGQRVRLADARREARLGAAGALELAGAAGDEATATESARALERAAWRMAMIAHVERTGQAPPWATGLGLADEAEALCAQARSGQTDAPGPFPPMAPPLKLSYSNVQDYLDCPRCFYLRRVLELDETPGSPQRVGTTVHKALEVFAQRVRASESEGSEAPTLDSLLDSARRLYFQLTPASEEVDPRLLEQVEAQVRAAALMIEQDAAQILEVERVVKFPFVHDGVEHRFTAKLDRVDQLTGAGGGSVFRIVDYKTGAATKKLLEPKKDDLQLCVYAMALRHLFEDPDLGGVAEYWVLRTGARGRIDFSELRLDKAHAQIVQAIEGMLAGRFERGKDCRGGCDLLGE